MNYRIVRFPRVGSTNDIVLDAAAAGAAPGLVVVADEQVTGKGRKARDWRSPIGGLWCSVLLDPQLPHPLRGFVPVAVGLAAADAVRSHGADARVRWPNDVMVGDRKAGGILVESRSRGGELEALVAGIGINVANEPPSADAVSLNEAWPDATPRALLDALLQRLADAEALLVSGDAKRLCEQFMARAWGIDRPVTIDGDPATVREIAIDGALIVERPDGTMAIVRSGSLRPRQARSTPGSL